MVTLSDSVGVAASSVESDARYALIWELAILAVVSLLAVFLARWWASRVAMRRP